VHRFAVFGVVPVRFTQAPPRFTPGLARCTVNSTVASSESTKVTVVPPSRMLIEGPDWVALNTVSERVRETITGGVVSSAAAGPALADQTPSASASVARPPAILRPTTGAA
jgi:hypothetical protein